ncbi:hypothetical protein IWW54_000636 [Coemansia sp. RSA 2705]|nr:hypothetical protein IWW54_000636 [Coemansia sp. RSA 2705]
MAMRAVYTGRANQGTLTAAAANERLYIIYGSGQDLVVHAENGRFVRQVTDERITDPITRIAASRSGRLAVVSRNRVLVFDADPNPSDSDKANWVYNAFADLDIAAGDASPIVCCWLNDDRLVLASRCTLFMLARTNNGWGCLKSWTTGCSVDVIAAAPDGAVFATATAGCQMVKVWQWAEDCDYMRFHYVVHSGSIRDIFWHQGTNTRKSGMQELVLYTVSQEGRLPDKPGFDDYR